MFDEIQVVKNATEYGEWKNCIEATGSRESAVRAKWRGYSRSSWMTGV